MRDTYKMKHQANDYYEGMCEFGDEEDWELDEEGDELPYCLEHITSVKLYLEDMVDTSDDYEMGLITEGKKRERGTEISSNDD